MERTGFRGLFCLGVAALAATAADPLVEAASNAGWFGRRDYTDHSNVDVIPALVVSAVLALLYVFLRAQRLVAPRSLVVARVRDSLRAGASKPVFPLLPAIFAMQLGVLYGMETIEQIVVAGHPLGGVIWLGAPAAIALVLHGCACVLTAYALAAVLDALTRAAVRIALFVCAIFLRQLHEHRRAPRLWLEPPVTVRQNPLASRSGKRAPPFLIA